MSRTITWDEYAKNTNNLECWVLIEGYIYDVTMFLAEHPGGDDILLKYSGFDGTERFNAVKHSEYAKSLRDARRVGKIQDTPMPEGHKEKVEQLKQKYHEEKRKREDERKNKIKDASSKASKSKSFSTGEVAQHNTQKDCWVIYDNRVFDVTKFQNQHPGGPEYLLNNAGKDITAQFDKVGHSSNAKQMREKLFIGHIEGANVNRKSKLPLLILLVIVIVGGLYWLSNSGQERLQAIQRPLNTTTTTTAK